MRRAAEAHLLVALCGDGALEARDGPLVDLSEVAQLHAYAQVVQAHLLSRARVVEQLEHVEQV